VPTGEIRQPLAGFHTDTETVSNGVQVVGTPRRPFFVDVEEN
jgi:hypothetical protein